MQKRNSKFNTRAFTLPEILIAVSIFSVVSMIVSTLYIQSFQETRKANLQNQVYEDARFILQRIAQEVRDGMIDYDEYYNQKVVIGNFGQNFGRYYSSFFYPGQDEALGFDCNDADLTVPVGGGAARDDHRNQRNCVPLRKTIDRNTGANPFKGKYSAGNVKEEDAFCGKVTYETGSGNFATNRQGECDAAFSEPDAAEERNEDQLYLISADSLTKTILAREKIGESGGASIYALSMLRMKGIDKNRDGIIEHFVCADDFQCRSPDDVAGVDVNDHGIMQVPVPPGSPAIFAELPRSADLSEGDAPADSADAGFSKDFVPVSPLRVNISYLNFFITPTEDPHYAFAESGALSQLSQPRVTIVLTVEQNPLTTGVYQPFEPITLTQTVSSRVLTPIQAPLLIQ